MTPKIKWMLGILGGLFGVSMLGRAASAGTAVSSSRPADPFSPHEPAGDGPVQSAQPGVLKFREFALARWGERPGSPTNIVADKPGEHREGRAWDMMTLDLSHGQKIADEMTANDGELARRAGIMYMIWNRRMWRSYPKGDLPAGSWGPYTGQNPHTDHIHFSFGWAGAREKTSLYV